MVEIVEDIIIGLVALSVIALTGWVFYLTRNPFSFLIPIALPMLRSTRGDHKAAPKGHIDE